MIIRFDMVWGLRCLEATMTLTGKDEMDVLKQKKNIILFHAMPRIPQSEFGLNLRSSLLIALEKKDQSKFIMNVKFLLKNIEIV